MTTTPRRPDLACAKTTVSPATTTPPTSRAARRAPQPARTPKLTPKNRRGSHHSRDNGASRLSGPVGGMPPALALDHLAVLLEGREHPVEVVLLDSHLAGHLRDRDPRTRADQREGLAGAGAAPRRAAPPLAVAVGRGRGDGGGGGLGPGARGADAAGRRLGRDPRLGGDPGEGARRRLELAVLLDQGREFAQAVPDLVALPFQKLAH